MVVAQTRQLKNDSRLVSVCCFVVLVYFGLRNNEY